MINNGAQLVLFCYRTSRCLLLVSAKPNSNRSWGPVNLRTRVLPQIRLYLAFSNCGNSCGSSIPQFTLICCAVQVLYQKLVCQYWGGLFVNILSCCAVQVCWVLEVLDLHLLDVVLLLPIILLVRLRWWCSFIF